MAPPPAAAATAAKRSAPATVPRSLLRQGHSYLDGNGDGEAGETLR